MRTLYTGKRILGEYQIDAMSIVAKDGLIEYVGTDAPGLEYDQVVDFGNNLVLPGFIDIHTHGIGGFDFADCSVQDIISTTQYYARHGVTAIMPTISSTSYEQMYAALERIESAMQYAETKKMASCTILGAHLEGPYFSEKQCGAQDKRFITAPCPNDYQRLTQRFGHIIKRWDYAPERDCNGEFADFLKANGILPSAGHTDAIYEDMMMAKQHGCKLITHLYSCTSTISREKGFRRLGVTECAYLWEDIYIELIADGKHLPPELLQLAFKLKEKDKIILVSDSLKVADCKEALSGEFKDYVIEDGVCKLPDRMAFAGSIATMETLFQVCIKDAHIDLVTVSNAASKNPAELLKLNQGVIKEGYFADFVVVDTEAAVQATYHRGEKVFDKTVGGE